MNRFSDASRDNFEFGVFGIILISNLTITNFLHYPLTFKWAKCLTLSMFSETPGGQVIYDLHLWFEMNLYDLALFLHADFVWWIDVCSLTYKLRLLKCRGKRSEYRWSHFSHI